MEAGAVSRSAADAILEASRPSDAEAALAGLTVQFNESRGSNSTWRMGVDVRMAVTDPGWQPEHDEALLNALLGIGALGGLPNGLAARSTESWEAVIAKLRAIKLSLAASGVKPERGRNHKCNPGYDVAGCKQARAPLMLHVLGRL